jgi:hypothetical protein
MSLLLNPIYLFQNNSTDYVYVELLHRSAPPDGLEAGGNQF